MNTWYVHAPSLWLNKCGVGATGITTFTAWCHLAHKAFTCAGPLWLGERPQSWLAVWLTLFATWFTGYLPGLVLVSHQQRLK